MRQENIIKMFLSVMSITVCKVLIYSDKEYHMVKSSQQPLPSSWSRNREIRFKRRTGNYENQNESEVS